MFIFIGCDEDVSNDTVDYYDDLQTKLILANSGETVMLPKGFIALNRSLWIDGLSNVTDVFTKVLTPV